jgi:phthalate 4,5-dioxygenase
VPAYLDFKENIHAKAYRATEHHGLNWVFMGEQAQPPNTWQIAYGHGRHVAQVHVMIIR